MFDLGRVSADAPSCIPPLAADSVLLDCTPVVNCYHGDVDPIRIDPARTEYSLRPSG